jgi:hypothetical protein
MKLTICLKILSGDKHPTPQKHLMSCPPMTSFATFSLFFPALDGFKNQVKINLLSGSSLTLSKGALTERPSDILTRTERPLDNWSTVTQRPKWQLDSKWTDCSSTPKMGQKVG